MLVMIAPKNAHGDLRVPFSEMIHHPAHGINRHIQDFVMASVNVKMMPACRGLVSCIVSV